MGDEQAILERLREGDERMRRARDAAVVPFARLRSDSVNSALQHVLERIANMPEPTPEELEAEARREAEQAAENERREAARARDRALAYVSEIPVPRDLLDAIVDDALAKTPAIEAVRRWDEERGKPVLVLLGGVGSGKTVAAAWWTSKLAREQLRATYTKMRDLANLYRAGFGDDAKAFDKLIACGALIIDELTTERDVDLGRAALNEVIDERAAKQLPTLLLANRTKKELAERYDARTIDRLRACAVAVTLADRSMRRGTW